MYFRYFRPLNDRKERCQQVSELRSGDICGELVATGLTPVATATVTASETCFMQALDHVFNIYFACT